ncbi:hypothetical protein [Pseudalkalibacillus berkeleyi]|uniref:DUF3899 domain-containing protein n=1 Tax=Pseudalkalibacillus berkeleyi TaxID=1069813 RepID=A0ABS9H4K4_9BACL|nr:hypothetical protein [Pseudalkalibacillus berkeleyi]MCF6138610.1 hypothetical protein [Pseudalkalibacillus berkeleyi]
MFGWIFPVGFWFAGTLIAASPGILFRMLEKEKEHLRKEAADTNFRDHMASIFFRVEENLLSSIPWWAFTLICSLLAIFFFTFGFIALSFVLAG